MASSVVPASLLTADNCEDSSRIRAFLRLSRIATDDTIREHLNELAAGECDSYFGRKIVPQWKARTDAIGFCASFARQLRKETESLIPGDGEYDLRLDPYAEKNEKDRLAQQFARCVAVENWVANEAFVEKIVRERTAKVLNDKCYYKDWLDEFRKFRA